MNKKDKPAAASGVELRSETATRASNATQVGQSARSVTSYLSDIGAFFVLAVWLFALSLGGLSVLTRRMGIILNGPDWRWLQIGCLATSGLLSLVFLGISTVGFRGRVMRTATSLNIIFLVFGVAMFAAGLSAPHNYQLPWWTIYIFPFGLLIGILYTLSELMDAQHLRYGWQRSFASLSIGIFILGFIGVCLQNLDSPSASWLFSSECGTTTLSDYYFYMLDNIAKGAVLDLLQSYDIHLWRCPPRKGSLLVGTLNFAIRGYVTYIVIRTALMAWRQWRHERVVISTHRQSQGGLIELLVRTIASSKDVSEALFRIQLLSEVDDVGREHWERVRENVAGNPMLRTSPRVLIALNQTLLAKGLAAL